jgi:hypothetical protein
LGRSSSVPGKFWTVAGIHRSARYTPTIMPCFRAKTTSARCARAGSSFHAYRTAAYTLSRSVTVRFTVIKTALCLMTASGCRRQYSLSKFFSDWTTYTIAGKPLIAFRKVKQFATRPRSRRPSIVR